MRQTKHQCLSLIFGVAIFLMAAVIQAQETAATAVSVRGMVTATNDDGETRRLRRGDTIYAGDRIETSRRARLRMSFTDGGTYVLKDQTTFEINDYSFSGQQDGTERAAFSLVQGALEALSGLIGKNNHESFRLDTPLATIGLRGTEFTITVLPPATPGGRPIVQLSVVGGTVVYQTSTTASGAPGPLIAVSQGNSIEQSGDNTPQAVSAVIVPLLTITVDGEDVKDVIEALFDAEVTEDSTEETSSEGSEEENSEESGDESEDGNSDQTDTDGESEGSSIPDPELIPLLEPFLTPEAFEALGQVISPSTPSTTP